MGVSLYWPFACDASTHIRIDREEDFRGIPRKLHTGNILVPIFCAVEDVVAESSQLRSHQYRNTTHSKISLSTSRIIITPCSIGT